MNLSIKGDAFYVDNVFLCHCAAGNGRQKLPTGRFEIATQYSHTMEKILADAYGLGWIGAEPGCDIILGSVRGRASIVPSQGSLGRLLALLEVAEGAGNTVWLEVVK